MKLVISIPVHEKPNVINDQIANIKKYLIKPIIVLHISKGYYNNYKEKDINLEDNVYINPSHLETSWGNIYKTHVSNFKFIREVVDFDYFVMHSSNDMYVKYGLEEYINIFEAGFNKRFSWDTYSMWWPMEVANKDEILKKIMRYLGLNRIVATQIEGSFYRKDIFEKIIEVLDKFIYSEDISIEEKLNYTREEIYFSTIASKFVDFEKCGFPTTFSEVHRFDKWCWFLRINFRRISSKFLPLKLVFKTENLINNKLFKSRLYKITIKDINKVIKKDKSLLYSYLNDYPGYFRLYDGNLFSVKRVERVYNNKIRKYIRNLF
ncbi:hypothetical protein [Megamonas sp.]